MELEDNALVRPCKGVLFREVDGEAVLLNLDDEIYFGLNNSGTSLWLALVESANIGEAIERLLTEFEVEESVLRSDVSELVAKLRAKGLVEVGNGG